MLAKAASLPPTAAEIRRAEVSSPIVAEVALMSRRCTTLPQVIRVCVTIWAEVIRGVRRCRDEAPCRPSVRGGRRPARDDRADRPARPAGAVGRLQPGPAA